MPAVPCAKPSERLPAKRESKSGGTRQPAPCASRSTRAARPSALRAARSISAVSPVRCQRCRSASPRPATPWVTSGWASRGAGRARARRRARRAVRRRGRRRRRRAPKRSRRRRSTAPAGGGARGARAGPSSARGRDRVRQPRVGHQLVRSAQRAKHARGAVLDVARNRRGPEHGRRPQPIAPLGGHRRQRVRERAFHGAAPIDVIEATEVEQRALGEIVGAERARPRPHRRPVGEPAARSGGTGRSARRLGVGERRDQSADRQGSPVRAGRSRAIPRASRPARARRARPPRRMGPARSA